MDPVSTIKHPASEWFPVVLHHFDVLLKSQFAGVRMNGFLELGGIGLIWPAAYLDSQNTKHAAKPSWKPAA